MRREKLRRLRNIGIAAHIDAGKTTLTERVLFFSGKSHSLGEVHTGNSQMDTGKMEIAKGITISSAATHTEWTSGGEQFYLNIIDTPGHVDFMIEVERSLRVLDGLVALFDSVAGVEPQSETIWQQAKRYNVPLLVLVNKMDRPGSDHQKVIEQIRERFAVNACAIQMPIGEEDGFEGVVDLIEWKAIYWDEEGQILPKEEIPVWLLLDAKEQRMNLLESLALLDEDFMLDFFENPEKIQADRIKTLLRKAVLEGQIVPVLLGAAYKNKGVQTLLDAVCDYLPSPLDRPAVEGTDPQTEQTQLRAANVEEAFSALAFKIALDEQNRQLCFFRVYSGSLKIGDSVWNPSTRKKERIGRLYQVHSNKRSEIETVYAGDIAATTGLKNVKTGDTLCNIDNPIVLESLFVPPPVISMSVEAQSKEQLSKLGLALNKLQIEDPSFKVQTDPITGQTLMLGMGELHLEVIVGRLKDDFLIDVKIGQPNVAYRESLSKAVRHKHRLKKQTGGSGQFAEIDFKLGPADPEYLESDAFQVEGKRLQFVSSVTGGSIPKEFFSAIVNGFSSMMEEGILESYPIESMKLELLDGSTHQEDSNAQAFESCAKEAFRAVGMQTQPEVLEPIVSVEINSPIDYMGNIISGLNRRRGMILSQNQEVTGVRIEAEVPLAEMFGYINHLRTVSSGRANYSMKFKHYAVLPKQKRVEVIG